MWYPLIFLLAREMWQSAMALASLIVGTTRPPFALLTSISLSTKRSGCATALHLPLPGSAMRKPSPARIGGQYLDFGPVCVAHRYGLPARAHARNSWEGVV